MKLKIEMKMEKERLDYFERMSKSLGMKGGVEELLRQELQDRLAEVEMWLDRAHITETVNP